MGKSIYYFSGTHWDREWYQTFQGFRYRLVKMMDGLLDAMENNKAFKVFHLDGQTIVLEDYAEIEPEKAQKLKKYIAENRIKVGPWYVMPDEFLLSGESLIRNLMTGHRLAKKWGAEEAWKFGYVCDIFGHIAQMPQIFNGFGIKYSLLCRGYYSDSEPYFIWQSPDGSECLNMRMGNRDGYGEFCLSVIDKKRGMSINTPEEARPLLKEYMDYLFTTTKFPVYIVMDALDHMPVHNDTPIYIEMIKEAAPDAEVHHVDLAEAGKELERYRGEMSVLRGELNKTNKSGFPDLITNTLSSYYTVKKANDELQNRLEKVIEPMLVYAAVQDKPLNRKYLKLAYKYLIQNHPHDSICGCSIDQVHKDMEYRFDQAKELCDVLETNFLIENTRPYFDEPGAETDGVLTLINTLPFDREEVISVDLKMKQGYTAKYSEQPFGYEILNSFVIRNADGEEIPYQITAVRNNQLSAIKDQYTQTVDIYSVTFKAFVPAGGRSEYRIAASDKPARYLRHMKSGEDFMENEFVKIRINPNGTISLFDKKTNRMYDNQLRLADDSEIGDGWYHAGAKEERIVYSGFEPCRVEKIESGCSRCVFRITKKLSLPKSLDMTSAAQTRGNEYGGCKVVFEVGLSENARFADIKMTVDNNIKDHRLRLIMPTYTDGNEYFAGQAFYCCKRKTGINYDTQSWREYEQYEKSMNGIVGKRGSDGNGLAFVSAYGLHECAAMGDENASVYVTLLRSFKRTVMTNGEVRGQLNRQLSYRFILAPVDEQISYADLVHMQDTMAAPLLNRYTEINPSDELEQPNGGFKLSGKDICLSILKCAEDEENAFVARVFNASDSVSEAIMKFPFEPSDAVCVNLNEEAAAENIAKLSGKLVSVAVKPWQIASVMVRR